jgi:multiple inositol-polyphosphate phosphatase/2,3-bisphosphoglycerate 3-phosphatase
MRKFNFIISALASVFCVLSVLSAGAQKTNYLGTKTPYGYAHVIGTPPPAGYRPVFINYVGRHGARFLTKAGADQDVLKVLETAEKSEALTKMGLQVKAIAERLQAASKGNYERITSLGREEQAGIGERIRQQYGPVFSGKGLEIVTTWKVRTQQSAEAFLKGFGKYEGALTYQRAPDSTDAVLRFYDLSPAYQRYKKNALIKRCLDSLDKDGRTAATAKKVCQRLFKPSFSRVLPAEEGIAFTDDLYDLYAIAHAMGRELNAGDIDGLGMAFDRHDLQWLDLRGGAADFMEKGPGFDPMGIQVKVAAPLLADFMGSMDRFTAGNGPAGVFRFTHAEAISPFAALLGIRGASMPVTSIYQYHDQWHAEDVIPLSANIQWVVYAGGGGSNLVKVLLNEREVVLPVVTRQWPYYRWEDVRAYYMGKLEEMGVGESENMVDYLRKIK